MTKKTQKKTGEKKVCIKKAPSLYIQCCHFETINYVIGTLNDVWNVDLYLFGAQAFKSKFIPNFTL